MMRYWVYQLLLWLTFPFWLYYSYRRCRQSAQTGECWLTLWGMRIPCLPQGCVWVHAVSLGEAQVALHLMRQLRHHYPELPLLFTAGNNSALSVVAQAQDLISSSNMAISYLPLDYGWIRNRWFDALQPNLLILIETELWPNLLRTAHIRHIPVAMIQARVSLRSRKLYPRYGQPLLGQLLRPIVLLAAQTEADRQFFISIGVKSDVCHCLGNLKYDVPLPMDKIADQQAVMASLLQDRWVWCAGSTHLGEEVPVLTAQQHLLDILPNSLLILAPRHLRHLEVVYEQIVQKNLTWITWSHLMTLQQLPDDVQVIVVDQLGVLVSAYQLAQVCFVGGSLVPWGGHNMLEPAGLKKPIVTGPHNHNFSEIAQVLWEAQALSIVHDHHDLSKQLLFWSEHIDHAKLSGLSAYQVFLSQQGATTRIINALSPWINSQWQRKQT